MRTIIIILSLIGIVSCNQLENQNKSNHFPFGSRWSFIKKDNKLEENYSEIEFNNGNILMIYSELDGQIGPYQYTVSGNELTFNNVTFSIISNKNGSKILRNRDEEFLLYEIPFDEKNAEFDQIDPFYLRRCYFLVSLGYITTDDAILYLSSIIKIPQDSIPAEEIILSKPK